MKPTIGLLLILVINWSCSHTVDHAALKAEIEKANEEFAQALAAKNVDALVAMYTDDASVMFPHMPTIKGKENIRTFFRQSIEGGLSGIKLTTHDVHGTDAMATEMGTYELMAGDQKVDEGKYLVHWRKIDGKWLLHWDMPTTDKPLPQPVAEVETN